MHLNNNLFILNENYSIKLIKSLPSERKLFLCLLDVSRSLEYEKIGLRFPVSVCLSATVYSEHRVDENALTKIRVQFLP